MNINQEEYEREYSQKMYEKYCYDKMAKFCGVWVDYDTLKGEDFDNVTEKNFTVEIDMEDPDYKEKVENIREKNHIMENIEKGDYFEVNAKLLKVLDEKKYRCFKIDNYDLYQWAMVLFRHIDLRNGLKEFTTADFSDKFHNMNYERQIVNAVGKWSRREIRELISGLPPKPTAFRKKTLKILQDFGYIK